MSAIRKLRPLDLFGVGIGPFNMGLAALLSHLNDLNYKFVDKNPGFCWHPGMLLKAAKLQVHYLKDLVSMVDPTNQYSFLAYLSEQNRLYQFVNRLNSVISRAEFNRYLAWASKKIPKLTFDEMVHEVKFDENEFIINTSQGSYASRHIVIGTGRTGYVPAKFKSILNEKVFHNENYMYKREQLDLAGKKVAVIGGGQSGAEIFSDLINRRDLPASITWVSKRQNFQPLEDTCFTNEIYTPSYVRHFYTLPTALKAKILQKQVLTSDGITQELLDSIYNKLYELKFVDQCAAEFDLLVDHALENLNYSAGSYNLELHDLNLHEAKRINADIVIFCTGYRFEIPDFFAPLGKYLDFTTALKFNPDYSLRWRHEDKHKIFMQNAARHSHGVADPNLSLAAWRNAVILNSLLGREEYREVADSPLLFASSKRTTALPQSLLELAS